MKKDIAEYKKRLIKSLKTISEDKDFILNAGSAAGGNEEDAMKLIEFIENENPTESEVTIFALEIYYSKKQD